MGLESTTVDLGSSLKPPQQCADVGATMGAAALGAAFASFVSDLGDSGLHVCSEADTDLDDSIHQRSD